MSNFRTTIMVPDAIDRFITEGYERLSFDPVTVEKTTAAFQEIINLLAILLPDRYGPALDDVLYFREMEANIHNWGHSRSVTPEAQIIGSAFLTLLKSLVESRRIDGLLQNTRLGEDPNL